MSEPMETFVVEEGRHSRFGPSSSKRWINCPASLALIDKVYEKNGRPPNNEAAAEGTAAHLLLEKCLNEKREPWEFIGWVIQVGEFRFTIDDGMASSVQSTIDLVARKMELPGAILLVETDLEYFLDPEIFGRGDICVIVPKHGIAVIDHKNGIGVTVEPDEPQLKMYGKMLLDKVESMKIDLGNNPVVELWISQPRKSHPKGPHRMHSMSGVELHRWWDDVVLPAVLASKEPDALLKAGAWCRFCPAQNDCPAIRGEVDEVKVVSDVSSLSNEEVARMLTKAPMIRKYLESIEKEGYQRAINGDNVPGFKLAHKKGNRVFKDSIEENVDGETRIVKFEEAVVQRFGDEAYQPRTLKTPPQIEKLVDGNRFVSKWAYMPQTGLTLVPESDPRVGIKPAIEQFMDQMEAK